MCRQLSWSHLRLLITAEAAGPWYLLSPEHPQKVFESIRFNCDEDVQQLRILGPKCADRFEQLAEIVAPYATRSWVDGRYLWLNFDWPAPLGGEPPSERSQG